MITRRTFFISGAVVLAGTGAFGSEVWRMGTMADYTSAIDPLRPPLPASPDACDLIRFVTLAVSSHNNKDTAAKIASSAGLAVFVGADASAANWVQVGRACQHFALKASSMGLKHAFLNQPVEVASLRPDLAAIIGMPGRRPDLVMRFGRGPALPFRVRRPVDEDMI